MKQILGSQSCGTHVYNLGTGSVTIKQNEAKRNCDNLFQNPKSGNSDKLQGNMIILPMIIMILIMVMLMTILIIMMMMMIVIFLIMMIIMSMMIVSRQRNDRPAAGGSFQGSQWQTSAVQVICQSGC